MNFLKMQVFLSTKCFPWANKYFPKSNIFTQEHERKTVLLSWQESVFFFFFIFFMHWQFFQRLFGKGHFPEGKYYINRSSHKRCIPYGTEILICVWITRILCSQENKIFLWALNILKHSHNCSTKSSCSEKLNKRKNLAPVIFHPEIIVGLL